MSLSATCGAPPSPGNGLVDFTNVIEGSEATFRCDVGPEMTAVCTASGEWVPNPGNQSCDTGRPSSTLTVVGFVINGTCEHTISPETQLTMSLQNLF